MASKESPPRSDKGDDLKEASSIHQEVNDVEGSSEVLPTDGDQVSVGELSIGSSEDDTPEEEPFTKERVDESNASHATNEIVLPEIDVTQSHGQDTTKESFNITGNTYITEETSNSTDYNAGNYEAATEDHYEEGNDEEYQYCNEDENHQNEGEGYDEEGYDEEGYGEGTNYNEGGQYDYNQVYEQAHTAGYDEGYTAGYNAGYSEAYAVANKSYQDQLAQLQPESKYLLNYDRLPKNAKKYWKQRYFLFKKFDQGIHMTSELWYSVTPEDIGIFVAKFIQACNPDIQCVADICCGGGGNTIQFARRFKKTICIDINDDNLYCTKKNCEVYGVLEKVELRQVDWTKVKGTEYFEYLKQNVDLIFSSPPWGGPAYKGKDLFDLSLLLPMPIKELLVSFFEISPNVVLFLPRNSDLTQLAEVTREILGPDAKCRVLYTYCGGYIKGITAIWGDKFMPENYATYEPDHPEHVAKMDMDSYRSRSERADQPKPTEAGSSVDIELDY